MESGGLLTLEPNLTNRQVSGVPTTCIGWILIVKMTHHHAHQHDITTSFWVLVFSLRQSQYFSKSFRLFLGHLMPFALARAASRTIAIALRSRTPCSILHQARIAKSFQLFLNFIQAFNIEFYRHGLLH